MNLLRSTIVLLLATTVMSSCKTTYIKKFYKETRKTARHDMGSTKVRLKADTVRVVYPELVMFDFGKDEIKPAAQSSLQNLSTVLKKYDRINFVINGYTDNVGSDEVNKSLSDRRAKNAKTLFETNGVSTSRMQTNGRGAENPVMSNETEDGRESNRRVELLLYERK